MNTKDEIRHALRKANGYSELPFPSEEKWLTESIVDEVEKLFPKWISAGNPPSEGGRYWCYVEEINSLGTSHYQWNCAYNEEKNRWSDRMLFGRVTHWMPLPPPPEQYNIVDPNTL